MGLLTPGFSLQMSIFPFLNSSFLLHTVIMANYTEGSETASIEVHAVSFKNICEATFAEQHRFSKRDVSILVRVFHLDPFIELSNRATIDSRVALCILLRKLVFPIRLCDLESIYGIHRSIISRTLNYLVRHIDDNFSYLLTLRKCICTQNSQSWANSISSAGGSLQTCLGFIDGTTKQICRPQRHQKKLYNGHKRYHCLKYQAVTMPNGIVMDLSGPFIGIRYDARMVMESNIVERMARCFEMNDVIYGDPAYGMGNHIVCPYEGSNLSNAEQQFNQSMSRVRISVEWEFRSIPNLFKGLQYGKHWKLFLQPVGLFYRTGVILANIYTCLYGMRLPVILRIKWI